MVSIQGALTILIGMFTMRLQFKELFLFKEIRYFISCSFLLVSEKFLVLVNYSYILISYSTHCTKLKLA